MPTHKLSNHRLKHTPIPLSVGIHGNHSALNELLVLPGIVSILCPVRSSHLLPNLLQLPGAGAGVGRGRASVGAGGGLLHFNLIF